jgi:hypothetical protein
MYPNTIGQLKFLRVKQKEKLRIAYLGKFRKLDFTNALMKTGLNFIKSIKLTKSISSN